MHHGFYFGATQSVVNHTWASIAPATDAPNFTRLEMLSQKSLLYGFSCHRIASTMSLTIQRTNSDDYIENIVHTDRKRNEHCVHKVA